MTTPAVWYPVHVEGHLDARLSRWLWLVKWILVIPHLVVLAFLWAGFTVLSVVAFVAVLATGRYPRPIFAYNLGVLRWSWRVAFYAYSALGTDRYPPFTLADVPDAPARLDIPYPEHLPRGLRLIRWWLIALPHYLVAAILVGSGGWFAADRPGWLMAWPGGVISALTCVAGLVLLFTGRYPRGVFDLVLGLNRWVLRAAAYAALMTDVYPPLRLDQGEWDGAARIRPAGREAVAVPRRPWLVTGAAIVLLAAAGLVTAGIGAVVTDATARDASGFLNAPAKRYTTAAGAVTSQRALLDRGAPAWLTEAALLGTVQLRVRSDRPLFAGIARTVDVRRYLRAQPPGPPLARRIWVASQTGADRLRLTWKARSGDWTAVVMNADASPGVRATLRAGARIPDLGAIGAGILGAGVVAGALGALLLARGLGGRRPRP